MEHGGIAVLVWIDGNYLGGCPVPVRAKHVIFLVMVCCAYLFWTGVDAVLGIGNGEWGPAYTDDALYPVLNWNSDQQLAATVSAVAICGVAPTCFAICWLASLWSYGGYERQGDQDDIEIAIDDENHVDRCRGYCCTASGSFDGSRRLILSPDPFDQGSPTPSGKSDYVAMDDKPIG